MEIVEQRLTTPWEGFLAAPAQGSDAGVLVLSGSSGRVEVERCRVLAGEGVIALSVRWFGGPGQAPGICEIPLETFGAATDRLRAAGARRISVLGTSKGAEAALLWGVFDERVDAVVALSPTSLVWGSFGPGLDGRSVPCRSSWSWQGRALPFVPYDESWTRTEPEGEPVSVRSWYEQSREAYAHLTDAAAIPVEKARAEVLLVAGGDDAMWPSLPYAEELALRRPVRLVSRPDAGHRIRLPGESAPAPSAAFGYGGSPAADAALGAAAWPHLLRAVRGKTS
ncbi:acyl-CoA thioester hydrolase/BAAT C-terminal domain-containing protein [Streptomyces sp. NBC_01465]|uniref:acyl-CoA thioester hydrolase/BAAT C-terminal domain-containing protein n=1 Tax=Streptomyces sp. NBC_01465 TaxID=2903878 RepID=UPI002E2EF4AD|nr:acyl-CoA thioester hydrolase/BAAT C-terminal domain-containing protein [Streptomyces sp. NBC_01465]